MTAAHAKADKTWFSDWLSRVWPRVHSIVSNEKLLQFIPVIQAVGITGAVAGFVTAITHPTKRSQYLFYINDIGHLILLLTVFFFFLPYLGKGRPEHNREGRDANNQAVGEFKIWLNCLVILWFIFYTCRAVADAPDALKLDSYRGLAEKAALAGDYVNTLGALAFFGMYMTAEYARGAKWTARERLSLPLVFILLGLTLQVIAHAAPSKFYRELNLLAGIVNGLIVGIATAVLVGRLDSKYIGLSKAVVITLYGYALIQPLFPYVFLSASGSAPGQEPPPDAAGTALDLQVSMQYTFVAIALVMKSILLLSLGKIIDTGTLHFYVGSMEWLDKHVATLRRRHERALMSDGRVEVEPYLFSLVPPDKESAKIHVGKEPDVRVQVGILNAWIGLSWEISELSVKEVQISESKFGVRKVRVLGDTPVLVSEDNRFVRVELDLDLDIDGGELKEELMKDPDISHALSEDQKTTRVKVVLDGLKAYASLGGSNHSWHSFESVDLTNRLFYHDALELELLK